jgi:hypothetical protein
MLAEVFCTDFKLSSFLVCCVPLYGGLPILARLVGISQGSEEYACSTSGIEGKDQKRASTRRNVLEEMY